MKLAAARRSVIVLVLWLASVAPCFAALTSAQLQTLKTDIAANTNTVTFLGSSVQIKNVPNSSDGAVAIAEWYNGTAAPAFRVWRTSIPTSEVKLAVVWTEYISRSVSEQNAFTFMLSNGSINGADANIRQGIADIFSGPTGLNTRTNLTAMAKRDATRIEKLFATGTGTDAVPAVMLVEGPLAYVDVMTARSL